MNALPVMKPYIGGEWIDSESQKFTTIYDPSTGKPIAQVPQCTAAEVEKAVAAAQLMKKAASLKGLPRLEEYPRSYPHRYYDEAAGPH